MQIHEILNYMDVLNQFNMSRIEEHVRFFSSLGTRMTGYPGYYGASNYIYNFLKKIANLSDVQFHNFTVTVPIDYGATLTILELNKDIEIYPLYPNLVATSSTPNEGISGRLIYAGEGDLAKYDNQEVDGSIVLMEFNSGRRWLEAVNLGAKAVIFIEPNMTVLDEISQKSLPIPLSFLRFYISPKDAEYLLSILNGENNGTVHVRVKSKMEWKKIEARNIIGFIKGTIFPDKIIVLSAYYDSFSIVPSLAPGAEESCGIAALLEMAAFFSKNNPSYTLMFLALSGHHQGISGARAFAEDFFFTEKWNTIGQKIILLINLDICSCNDWIAPTVGGGWIFFRDDVVKPWGTLINFFISLKERVETAVGKIYKVTSIGQSGQFHKGGYAGLFPAHFFPIDSQAFTLAGAPAFSIITPFRWGRFIYSPLDTFEKINVENLRSQIEYALCSLYTLANIDLFSHIPALKSGWSPGREEFRYGHVGGAFGILKGTVATWNQTIGWYSSIPNALVCWVDDGPMYPMRLWWDAIHVDMADENGNFKIYGVATSGSLASGGEQAGSGFRKVGSAGTYQLSAFVVDSTGSIVYATDFGKYKWISGPERVSVFLPRGVNDIGYLVVFECGSLVLLDLYDSSRQQIPLDGSLSIKVNSFYSHATPDSYSWYIDLDPRTGYSVATIFIQPTMPVEILVTASYARRYPLLALINASRGNPMGSGYTVNVGEQYIIKNSALHYAENLYFINEKRFTELQSFHIEIPSSQMHINASEFIKRSRECLSQKLYNKAYALSNWALSLERYVYVDVRKAIEDSVISISFFAAILIPFAFLSERLLIGWSGVKRLSGVLLVILIYLSLFLLFHPGFKLAGDAPMILIGFTSLILTIPILLVILDILLKYLREITRKKIGTHLIEIKRMGLGIILLSFSTGIENLKRRKVRSLLILLQVIIVSTSITSFTSLSPISYMRPDKFSDIAPYSGILIRELSWGRGWIGFNEKILDNIKLLLGDEEAVISPRAWIYPGPGPLFTFIISYGSRTLNETEAILGFTHKEAEILPVKEALISGDWFKDDDCWCCILPNTIATKLGVSVNETIYIMELPFKVSGIVNETRFSLIKDLDQESVTPLLLEIVPGFGTHLITEVCIIVPYKTAIHLGGTLMSISLKTSQNSTLKMAETLYFLFRDLNIYFVSDEKTYIYRSGISQHLFGWQYQILPVFIAILSILSLSLGSLNERKREIMIYSTVGLSPSHITMMFLGEYLIYAIVGSITGYLISLGSNYMLNLFGRGLHVNTSSSWVLIILCSMMLIIILSTIYPAYVASSLTTPSKERVWVIPTEPKNDEWIIPLPFVIESDNEAKAVTFYLYEYMESHLSPAAEQFWVLNLQQITENIDGVESKTLDTVVRLAPYEANIVEDAKFRIIRDNVSGKYFVQVFLHRRSGEKSVWRNLNKSFVDNIRKQLLLWRSLNKMEKERYGEGLE
ncbi:MAG: FtsX-like permease family protein [Candidatus Bathyarchaeia archaeon]